MARISSALILLALACLSLAQPFGRFGYAPLPVVPGFIVDREGFVAKYPGADRFLFDGQVTAWKPFETTDMQQVIGISGIGVLPTKLRIDLTAPGFSLYCPNGLSLRLKATSAPYLSWPEGTVGGQVPTPDVSWIAVSFSDQQPAVILGLPGLKASFIVRGKPGAWNLECVASKGWVRVGLVTGTRPVQANSAHSLGLLASKGAAIAPLYTQMPPALTGLQVDSDPTSVTATWAFDRPGAVVPYGAALAPLGGYSARIVSKTSSVDAPTEEGPLEKLIGTTLTIRFPAKRIPAGRALAVGGTDPVRLGTISPIDVPSVVALAFENLLATSDSMSRNQADEAGNDYIAQSAYVDEPWTHQKLPFAADGTGIDVAAAQALLAQSVTSAGTPTSEGNALISSVVYRRDWLSWRVWAEQRVPSRRASALVALAACLCPEPERRLDGAMLQAGLAAERGLQVWLARRGGAKPSPLLETLPSARAVLYSATKSSDGESAFVRSLLSPIRVYGATPVKMSQIESGFLVSWPALEPKPSLLNFAAGYPILIQTKANLTSFASTSGFGMTELRFVPDGVGTCEAIMRLPDWATALPKAAEIPPYSEANR